MKYQSATTHIKAHFLALFLLVSSVILGMRALCMATPQEAKPAVLSKQIIEADSGEAAFPAFEALKELYYSDHNYSGFIALLQSLNQKKKVLAPFVSYYTALTRYRQLEYLESSQDWNTYFSNVDAYRQQTLDELQNTIQASAADEPVHVYAKLLLWKFYRSQQEGDQEALLNDLMNSAFEYAHNATPPAPLKDVADTLLEQGLKSKAAQLYREYVDSIIAAGAKEEELKAHAETFYKEGKLELSEALFDALIEKASLTYPKEKLASLLTEIARLFMYKDKGLKDTLYAEKVLQELQKKVGDSAFDETLTYERAFNLEKAKEYTESLTRYTELLTQYPETTHLDEAMFKAALMYAYVKRDLVGARKYFKLLAQKERSSPQAFSSSYQLGLLAQWEGNIEEAKAYYNEIIEKAKGRDTSTVRLTRQRLKEIEEAKPIEYNLKMFLDVALKGEYASYDMSKVGLEASAYRPDTNTELTVTSNAYVAPTGCMQVEVEYLWSGDTGGSVPATTEPSFTTSYASPGTKEVNLVVVSPSGVIDRNFDILDVR
ncbi:MAG: tetratricopeptide repeat protein [Candidatus Omnitrophota bacterium]